MISKSHPSRRLRNEKDQEWAESGFIGADGRLGTHISTGFVFRPPYTIRIEGASLRWESEPSDFPAHNYLSPTPEMFDEFVNLWNKDDSAILAFAEVWGPLRIDPHGRLTVQSVDAENAVAEKDLRSGIESLAAWRFFSRRAYSVLKVAFALSKDMVGDESDWIYILEDTGDEQRDFFGMPNWSRHMLITTPGKIGYGKPTQISAFKKLVGWEMSHWMRRYRVGVSCEWDASLHTELSFDGMLLSAIALQIVLTVLQRKNFYSCSGCERLYSGRQRKPKPGLSNFCEACKRKGIAQDNAELGRQKRRALAKEMFSEGKSVEAIAEQIGSKVSAVRKFVKGGSNVKTR